MGLIFLSVRVGSWVVVNAGLLVEHAWDQISSRIYADQTSKTLNTDSIHSAAQLTPQENKKRETEREIQQLIANTDPEIAGRLQQDYSLENTLKSKLDSYELTFNTLPPTNRLIITSLQMDVPIVDASFKAGQANDKGTYEQELYQWVVKYPSTPIPSQGGNTFLFGHSSFYRRKDNPYGTVFRRLPELKEGDRISIVRNGKQYDYEMIARHIVSPSKVNAIYNKYVDGNYLTLMGCYPIGSDAERILIIAKKVASW